MNENHAKQTNEQPKSIHLYWRHAVATLYVVKIEDGGERYEGIDGRGLQLIISRFPVLYELANVFAPRNAIGC